ncbi:MAG TPA: metal-sensitive transcriptional regulator [Acidimicrobiales bacterium]|nr:metal-sensitive transcriptional regulator [Acidimicrobiales bacterium]
MAKPAYIEQKSSIQKRLKRIEGQIRGLQRMVDEDQYCINILDQVSATTHALRAVALNLLGDHLTHCLSEALAEGGPSRIAKVEEAQAAIRRLVRS